jgi:hypothetical protein
MPVQLAERGVQTARQATAVTKPQQKERKMVKWRILRIVALVVMRRRAKQMLPLTNIRETR